MGLFISKSDYWVSCRPSVWLPAAINLLTVNPRFEYPLINSNSMMDGIQVVAETVKFTIDNTSEVTVSASIQNELIKTRFDFAAQFLRTATRSLPAIIPPLLYTLWASKVETHQTIYLEGIKATEIPKTYTVAMGKNASRFSKGKEIGISFEIELGKQPQKEPIRYLRQFTAPIIRNTSWIGYFPLLNNFEWKREVFKVVYVIDVEHTLLHAPVDNEYPITNSESFIIRYRNPNMPIDQIQDLRASRVAKTYAVASERFKCISTIGPIKVRHDLGAGEAQYSVLPIAKDPAKTGDYYTKITHVK